MNETRIALVTGAAQGIGFACAQALVEEGYRVAVADIDAAGIEAAARKLGDGARAYVCDMGDPERIIALFDRIEAELGPVSALVNNAGIAKSADFLDVSLADFRQVIDVNLIGTFVATQRAAKTMVARKIEGAIVNMSSINAVVSIPAIASYSASKGAVMQLTKAAALALAPHNIRVNAVGPGSIDTAMMAGVNANPDAMRNAMSRTPLKRMGTPREVGDIVAFLLSAKAGYVTGETIYVDGGRLALNYTC